MFEKIKKKKLK